MTTIEIGKMTQLNPNNICEVLSKHHVEIPRCLRRKVLLDVIQPKYIEERDALLKQQEENDTFMSVIDFARMNRLINNQKLSEFQIENDYLTYNDPDLNESYIQVFWKTVLKELEKNDDKDAIFDELNALEENKHKNKLNVYKYNHSFACIITDDENYFDGIHLSDEVTHFNSTSDSQEIIKLGRKYDINVPNNWKKADMELRLVNELKSRNQYDEEAEMKIKTSKVSDIREMLDELGVDSKLHLTKKDMINLIIKSVDRNGVSELAKEEVIIEEKEEMKEAPILVSEKIKNEESAEEMKTVKNPTNEELCCSQLDYTDLLKEIIENQKLLLSKSTVETKKTRLLDKVFNYIVIILIVVVVILWIYFGVTALNA